MVKNIVYFLVFLLFLFSTLQMVENIIFVNYFIYIINMLFLFLIVLYKDKKLNLNKTSFYILSAFVFVSFLSALTNNQIVLIITSTLLLISYLSLSSFLNSIKISYKKVVGLALISNSLIIVIPLILYGFDSQPYKGIFFNPNAMGVTLTTILIILLSNIFLLLENYLIHKSKYKLVKIKLIISSFIFSLFFYLLLLTSSRTSFLTVIVVICIGFLVLLLKVFKYKSIKLFSIRLPIITVIFLIAIFTINKYFNISTLLGEGILSKFRKTNGDVLNGREHIWEETIKTSGFFGHGNGYFIETFNIGPHNTFILILGTYGWIALLLFIFFIFLALIKAFKKVFTLNMNSPIYLPLFSILCFVSLSMGEGMLYSFSMLLMFYSIGSVLNNSQIILKS